MNIQISIRKTIAIAALLLIVCAGLGHSDDSIYAQQSPVDATDPTNGNGTLLLPIIISGNNTDNEVDQGSGDTPSDQVSDDDQSPEEPDNNPYLSTEHDDVYWAEQTADQEPFVVTEEMLQAAAANNVGGQWGSVIQWPHTPVSIANLPNGKIMTFSGSERRSWPDREQTYSAVWDPSNNSFDEIFNNNHNMFCADMVSMDDGRILVNGGRNTVSFASIFDPFTNSWSRTDNMNDERWYPTSVPLPDGRVFTAVGQNNRYPEVWTDGQGWRRLTGADLQGAILNYGSGRDGAGWWPLMHLDPRGKILHYGATPYMHSIDPNGNGSVNGLGRHNLNWFPEESVAIQFDENRILIAGGANDINQEESATNRAAILDMSNAQPNVYTINSMHYARQHANEVVLPDGQVLVIGGTTSGQKFSDNGSVMTPELWNPATGQWRDMNNMAVPRNYHSTALLLTDGRVLSAGGGYHWDDGNHFSNHPDGQVFSPPYLFNNFGSPAQRPQILQAPTLAGVGSTFSVSTSEAISRFTMVRMSATTHTMNPGQRFLEVSFTGNGGSYSLTLNNNENVLLPGYWMLFALNNAGVPSVSKVVEIRLDPPPPGQGEGTILAERWNGIGGTAIDDLTSNGDYPNNPDNEQFLDKLEIETNVGGDYGMRLRGYLHAPATGQYRFWIASDDNGELWLSNGRSAANANRIAYVPDWTGPRDWNKYDQQQSGLITLQAGQKYYVEALFKEGGGNDNLAVAWQIPGYAREIIRGDYLSPYKGLPEVESITSSPKQQNSAVTYTASAISPNGNTLQYKWLFGDNTPETNYSTSPSISHSFSQPGRYIVTLTVRDADGEEVSIQFPQSIYTPRTANRPASSTSILLEERTGSDWLWVANPDNDSVSIFNTATGSKVDEIGVGDEPRNLAIAPNGRIWVTNQESATISIINEDTRAVVNTINLPRGSKPFGIVFGATSSSAFAVLEGTGKVLKLDGTNGSVQDSVDVGQHPRHIAIDANGSKLYVSRFITPRLPGEETGNVQTNNGGGEVVVLNAGNMNVMNTVELAVETVSDFELGARGVPNYLGAPVISPDGATAWVPSKQDNVLLGGLRDGEPLNFQHTVRAISSRIATNGDSEDFPSRIDHDNASLASAGLYDLYGNFLFVALETSREVAVIDAYQEAEIFRIDTGIAPQGLALSADGLTLYVHNFMDRTVTVHDLTALVNAGEENVSLNGTYATVANETLSAEVLLGKQLFYDARDTRLAKDEYMSCASCHNDGGHDGRVWDFTNLGEGLRNTISLEGHGGPEHGRLHWSANFDEIHDFEGQIRELAGGTGLMSDSQFNSGTRATPLGNPKAGISNELDALAAYVTSLRTVGQSPYRTSGGALTTDARAGKTIFEDQNCQSCHGGFGFTDSAVEQLHNIGTIKPSSGSRSGGTLTGLDTPTLRGLWATAPYLHDGSAATLGEAVQAHNGVNLSGGQLTQLVAYLNQIDDSEQGFFVNYPPSLSSPGNQNHIIGESIVLALNVSDANVGDSISISASGLPSGLSLDANSGEIRGTVMTPSTNTVTVTAVDAAGDSDSVTFTWAIADPANGNGHLISAYQYGEQFSPPSSGTFGLADGTGFRITANPEYALFVDTDATLDGDDGDANEVGVDGSQTVLINGVERRAFFDFSLDYRAGGTTYTFYLIDVDLDGDNSDSDDDPEDGQFLILAPGSPTPPVGSTMSLVPDSLVQPITLRYTDLEAEIPTNEAPMLTSPGNQNDDEGDNAILALNATDPDGDTLTYTATGLPSGLSLNSRSGTISGAASTEGEYTVTATVSDGNGGSDSVTFGWTIAEPVVVGDVNCSGNTDTVDALFIMQHSVGMRTDSSGCPLTDMATQLNIAGGDVNNDGNTDTVDSLFILQCVVEVENVFCPAGQ